MVSDRILRGALAALLVVGALEACSEQVSTSLGCPDLCTDQSAVLRDTILAGGVVVDSSLLGFAGIGDMRDITLLNQGDTADVRLVARFDTLPQTYRPTGASADSAITRVDSASLIFFIDTLTVKPTSPITVDAFDVDTTAKDTATSALIPLFRDSRLIGSKTFATADIKDTLRMAINNGVVFGKIRDTLRLRIGLRVRGSSTAKMRVLASQVAPRVRFRVSADTTVRPDTVFLRSRTPSDDPFLASVFSVFPLVAKGNLPPPPKDRFVVGGLSGARAFLKFDIPGTVIDSVQVIRASLLLTQTPARSTARVRDTLILRTHPILASPAVTDLATAMNFLGASNAYGVDSVRFAPADSGARSIELVNLFRFWRAIGAANSSRSIVLRAASEGANPGELTFFSLQGPPALRPKLRITYVPRRGFGLP